MLMVNFAPPNKKSSFSAHLPLAIQHREFAHTIKLLVGMHKISYASDSHLSSLYVTYIGIHLL